MDMGRSVLPTANSCNKCTGDLDLGYDVNDDDAKEENYQFQAHCVAVTEEEHSLYKTISPVKYIRQNEQSPFYYFSNVL